LAGCDSDYCRSDYNMLHGLLHQQLRLEEGTSCKE